jgi:hypothetical protein
VARVTDIRGEIREFLTTRRAKITPARAGLPDYGGRRRVTGLRRDEVAQLAGIPADPGQTIVAYSAEPGSRSAQGLSLLASWAATNDPEGESREHTA